MESVAWESHHVEIYVPDARDSVRVSIIESHDDTVLHLDFELDRLATVLAVLDHALVVMDETHGHRGMLETRGTAKS